MSIRSFLLRCIQLNDKELKQLNIDEIEKRAIEIMDQFVQVLTKDNQYELLDKNEILIIEKNESESLITTAKGTYKSLFSSDVIMRLIKELNLHISDKGVYVNVARVRKIHSSLRLLLFNDVASVSEAREQSLPIAYVSGSYLKHYKNYLGIENDLAYKLEKCKTKEAKWKFIKNISEEF